MNFSSLIRSVISCEMIEAVGHAHLGEFMEAAEMLLAPGGILVSPQEISF